jgi:FkbM family methyltransferase
MNLINTLKSFLSNNFKNKIKEKLNLNLIIWLPSNYILNQEISVSKFDKNYLFVANGGNPINDTLYEIFDYDCYFLDRYKHLLSESVVFDIGANIGVFSVITSSLGAKVFAVEPDKLNIDYLSKNMNLNNVNFDILNVLLFYRRGLIDFNMLGSVSNSIIFDVENSISNKIEAILVSDLLDKCRTDNNTKYKIIKMDIEGAEYDIFNSKSFSIGDFDIYVMEVHDINKVNNISSFIKHFDNQFEVCIKKDFHNRNFLNTIIAIKRSLL